MSAKTERRSRRGLESRAKILDAAFAIASEVGYLGTSMSAVSARSGLPASSIYWHFADKDAMFADVISRSFEHWWADVSRWEGVGVASIEGVEHDRRYRVAHTLRSAVDSISTNPQFWRLGLMLALEQQPVEPLARRRFIEIRQFVLTRIERFWSSMLDDAAAPSPRTLARFTLAAVDGIFVSAQAEGFEGLDDVLGLLVETLTRFSETDNPAE